VCGSREFSSGCGRVRRSGSSSLKLRTQYIFSTRTSSLVENWSNLRS
jgi:hypothetical protein